MLLCPYLMVMFMLLHCILLDAASALQGITCTESDELWQQHAGPVMASLDSAGEKAVLAVLFQLMKLRRCRLTIEGKGWWGVTAKLVVWIYCSRVRGVKASSCLPGKRKATAEEVSVARLLICCSRCCLDAASHGLHGCFSGLAHHLLQEVPW